ncbi:MAG: nitrophenyl compound nitroreductase subunit ArsF family protein [Candidatus Shapirobacteria bacterium]|nr:nitrophenyl compound nitroreductase subunit ArsF family protein [Candidatus Shapirobacteria bacterium]
MNKFFIIGSVVVVFIFILAVFQPFKSKEEVVLSAQDQQPIPTQTISTSLPSGSEKIEVLHFHATQQCISCINIGKFTKAVIEEKFPEEMQNGKIIFKTINIDLPENYKIANDYKVSGSALYINAIKDGNDNREEDTTVWRLVTNEAQLKSYFEAKLKKLL